MYTHNVCRLKINRDNGIKGVLILIETYRKHYEILK